MATYNGARFVEDALDPVLTQLEPADEAVGVARGRVAFLVINLVSVVSPLAWLALPRYALGRASPIADSIAAKVVGIGLGTLARFWAIRSLIFVGPAPLETRAMTRRG